MSNQLLQPQLGIKWRQRIEPRGRLTCRCGPLIPWEGGIEKRIIGGRSEKVRIIKLQEEKDATAIEGLKKLGPTPREAEVLHWISQGKRNEEISIILSISVKTVKKHCENMFVKLGVENRASAAAMALHLSTGL